MAIRQYKVKLEGITPLLMHWDNIEWADQMEIWRADPANKRLSKAGDDRTPAFRWIGCVYHDGKAVSISADNLARCLMEGGAMVPVPGGRGNKTFKSQTQSGMKVDSMFVTLMSAGKAISWPKIEALIKEPSFPAHLAAVKQMGFKLFTKRARIGATKHIRVRPCFDNWSLEFTISVWDEQITEDVLTSLFDYAGNYKGLCDWRPGSKTPGPYGMFKLASLSQA